MNALVSKEVRLVLPAYAMALVLAVAPLWLFPRFGDNTASEVAVFPFWFGAAMLALSSFGREFGMNTFSLILVQPLERTRIWWTKVGVLAGAMASLLAAWWLSWAAGVSLRGGRPGLVVEALTLGGVGVAVAFAGGLWTTLLFRQVAAAFWFTLLVPGAILALTASARTPEMVTYAALLAYSAGGFWLAWWQFQRAQEVGWTGGLVALAGWRRSAAASTPGARARRSLRTLLWKELQLHQVGLAGMALLFLLHVGVVAIRKAGAQALGDNVRAALEMFGGIWLIVPLVLASASVAEERKLGTMDSMMCQPISTRLQFGIKLLFALVLGGLLSAGLLWTAESIGAAFGVGTIIGGPRPSLETLPVFFPLSAVFLALAFVGFYASTASRHIVQAMAVAVAASLGVWTAIVMASRPLEVFGVPLWGRSLAEYVGLPTLAGCFLWLAWRNFKSVSGGGLWRRNVLALAGSLVFIAVVTSLLYNRAWEWVTPLEPAHGPAKIAGPNAVRLSSRGWASLWAVMSDGRLWVDRVAYNPGRPIMVLHEGSGIYLGGKWTSMGGNHFVGGTNWVDAAANFAETIGIRSDGSLWVSEKPRRRHKDAPFTVQEPALLVRFGAQTDWQGVARDYTEAATLLKKDGTLWTWGTNSWSDRVEWPGLRSFQPRRLGTESDWAKILSNEGSIYLWKADGSAWMLDHTSQLLHSGAAEVEPGTVIERMRGLDNLRWRSLARFHNYEAGVREDGTLWVWKPGPPAKPAPDSGYSAKLAQVGKDTDWCAVGGGYWMMVALKADGSIWTWEFSWVPDEGFRLRSGPPMQLGSHRDWVAVGNYWAGAVTLAADGSLWFWYPRDRQIYAHSDQPLLAPSRRPAKIENIFEGRN